MTAAASSDRDQNPGGATDDVARLVPNADVVGQRLEDGFVLVHLKSNQIFELSPTASRFWDLLQSEPDRGRIEVQLLAEFDVSEGALKAELDELIAELLGEDLVRPID